MNNCWIILATCQPAASIKNRPPETVLDISIPSSWARQESSSFNLRADFSVGGGDNVKMSLSSMTFRAPWLIKLSSSKEKKRRKKWKLKQYNNDQNLRGDTYQVWALTTSTWVKIWESGYQNCIIIIKMKISCDLGFISMGITMVT